jgi:hypothetical protein
VEFTARSSLSDNFRVCPLMINFRSETSPTAYLRLYHEITNSYLSEYKGMEKDIQRKKGMIFNEVVCFDYLHHFHDLNNCL